MYPSQRLPCDQLRKTPHSRILLTSIESLLQLHMAYEQLGPDDE